MTITHVMFYDAAAGGEDVTVAAIRPDGSVDVFPDDDEFLVLLW